MECGGCTLCCELFKVKWLDKPAFTPCKHMCSIGCAIHQTKEEECKAFDCAYVQMKSVDIKFRPDHCKVVFEKINDHIFFGTQDPNSPPTETAKAQVRAFIKQGFSVVINEKGKQPKLFLAEKHKVEVILKELTDRIEENSQWQLMEQI